MGDGEFWIDPDASGNPLKVYCDMTTDKGRKTKSRNETSVCHCVEDNSVRLNISTNGQTSTCIPATGKLRDFDLLMCPWEQDHDNRGEYEKFDTISRYRWVGFRGWGHLFA